MKIIYLILIFSFLSCKETDNQAKNVVSQKSKILDSIMLRKKFINEREYEALSLIYDGKPLKIIGKKTDAIRKLGISFRDDPNLEFQEYPGIISDYLSMDDNLQIKFIDNQSINGIVFFSTISENEKIFAFSGNWTIDVDVNALTKDKIRDNIVNKLFPKLKNKIMIEDGWQYKIENKNLVENFKIEAPNKNKSQFWNLKYSVTLK